MVRLRKGQRSNAQQHVGFLRHAGYRWAWVGLALSIAAAAGYVLADVQPRPNGGSWYGYLLGTIGAVLIVWLTMLGVRKRAITRGNWSLKAWVSAHVYLGIALVAIATLHSGLQFGWNIHTLAYGLMMLVVLSGLYGVAVYATLPKSLSNNRGETTQKQMVEAIRSLDRQLNDAAQPLNQRQADAVQLSIEKSRVGGGFLRRLDTRPGDCGTRRALKTLRKLNRKATELERTAGEGVMALLERKSAALYQLRRHLRIRSLLSAWLAIHVPASIALLMALTAHIVSVFIYW
ncbi:MAG TPA: hypothetical protein VEA44_06055 [Caulobacter sp.]|nr:hypothetical protein [Caulobacter sp.]